MSEPGLRESGSLACLTNPLARHRFPPQDLLLGAIRAAGAPVICETKGDMAPDIAVLRGNL